MDREILELFESGIATIALRRNGEILYTSYGRGIGPALRLFDEQPELLCGSEVSDLIVGKAAASLFILAGAARVCARTLSEPAADLLGRYGIPFTCEELPAQIINRSGTGLCPFEQAVCDLLTPEECLPVIRETLAKLQAQ